jgi:hypothetical protein
MSRLVGRDRPDNGCIPTKNTDAQEESLHGADVPLDLASLDNESV